MIVLVVARCGKLHPWGAVTRFDIRFETANQIVGLYNPWYPQYCGRASEILHHQAGMVVSHVETPIYNHQQVGGNPIKTMDRLRSLAPLKQLVITGFRWPAHPTWRSKNPGDILASRGTWRSRSITKNLALSQDESWMYTYIYVYIYIYR